MAAQLPTPPTNPTLVYSTTSTITFEWYEPEDDGGSPIIDYQIYWNAGIVNGPFVLLQNTTLNMNIYYQQSNLTAGTYYTYKIRAINYIGLSPYSSSIVIVAASVPQQPGNLVRVTSTSTTVTFSW